MADQNTIDIYTELYRRKAVPPEHAPVVDELVRRGVIKADAKYGPGDTLPDGAVLDDQGLERGTILPIARDPNTNSLSLAVPGMIYNPFRAFRESAQSGTVTPGSALEMAGLAMPGTRFRGPASPNSESTLWGSGIRRAEKARGLLNEFESAGVPAFGPAVAGGAAASSANKLMEGYFGGPLRANAQRSIEGVESGVRDAVASTGGNRSVGEIGAEVKDFLRTQITDRNPDVVPERMTQFAIQDVSGIGPGPNAPRNAPPVPKAQPEPWIPQRRAVLDDDVEAALQTPPRMPTPLPKLMTIEDVILPPKLERSLQDTRASAASAEQFMQSNADAYQSLQQRMQQLNEAEKALPPQPRPRPVGGRYADPQEQAAEQAIEQAYNATLPQRRKIEAEWRSLEQQYSPFAQAERALADADDAARAANAYRSENLQRTQKAEADRVSSEAQDNYNLRMADARRTTREQLEGAADAQYQADRLDPVRKTAFENQARNRARADTEQRQFEADTAYRTELEARQPRAIPESVGGRSRQPYNTEFDVGYEGARRNTPPMQMNPLGRTSDTQPTRTAQLLDSVALDFRKQGLLPGYRRGDLFAANGAVRDDVLAIVDKLGGPGVAERIRALSNLRGGGSAQLGIDGLDKIRTAVGQALSDARQRPIGGQTQGEGASQRARAAFLSRLYDALGKDVDQAVANVPGGHVAAQQREVLRNSYKQFMTEIRAPLARVFGEKSTPEQAVKMITDAARSGQDGNSGLIRAYFKVADEKGDRVRAAGVLLNSMTEDGLTGFLSRYRGMSPDVRSILMQGETAPLMRRLDQLAHVGGYLERFARAAKPDQSMTDVARRAASGQNVLGALVAYVNAPAAIAGAVGAAGASRVLASRKFMNWYSRTPTMRTPMQINNHVSQLLRIAAVELGLQPSELQRTKAALAPGT